MAKLSTFIISLSFLLAYGCRHGDSGRDASLESKSKAVAEFYVGCVGHQKEFSVTISGCGSSSVPQTGKISWTDEDGKRVEDPVLKVEGQSSVVSNKDLVIGVSGKQFAVDFPKRWCGKSNDRLEKINSKFGYEVKELVGFKDKKTSTSEINWVYCYFESK